MKKYFFLFFAFIIFVSELKAEVINEYMNDIYFANGINTSKQDAEYQLNEIISKEVLITQFNGDFQKMKQSAHFKLAYNNTLGLAFDLLESYNQKQAEHATFWWVLGVSYDVAGSLAGHAAKKVTKEFLKELILEQLKKVGPQFITGPLIAEAGLDDLVNLVNDLRNGASPANVWKTLVDSAKALENYDVAKQLGGYKNSIKQGHSVIVIAHSQGNLFTNVVYDKIAKDTKDKWMIEYFHMIGVASPADKSNTGPKGISIVTFDNDPISYIPNVVSAKPYYNLYRNIYFSWLTDNGNQTRPYLCLPNIYYVTDIPKSCVDISDPEYNFWSEPIDIPSVDFHYFSYYMKNATAKDKILSFVGESLKKHTEAKSQWEPKNLGCLCKDKYAKMTHVYDPEGMKLYMGNEKVKDFLEEEKGKIYRVDTGDHMEYVRALDGGKTIETIEEQNSNLCYVLKDDNVVNIGEIRGSREVLEPNPGVVEVFLDWDNAALDYDLKVEWDAGEVDVKDTGCTMEHFHVLSEREIFPGRYIVSVVPKDSNDPVWEDNSTYPHSFTVTIKTPGASWEMEATVLSKQNTIEFGSNNLRLI